MKGRVLASIVTLVSCTSGDPSLLVLGVLAPPTPSASMCCLFSADVNGPFLDLGTVDTTLASDYSAVILLGNESLTHGSTSSRLDLEDALVVEQATVIDFEADGTTEIDRFTEEAVALVSPPSAGSLGLGTVSLELVSSHALHAAKGSRILANVRLDGRLPDGTRTESGAFVFAVDLCSGCLVSCPSSGACVVGQDQPICQ